MSTDGSQARSDLLLHNLQLEGIVKLVVIFDLQRGELLKASIENHFKKDSPKG